MSVTVYQSAGHGRSESLILPVNWIVRISNCFHRPWNCTF